MKYLVCLQRDGYSHTLRILRVPTTTPSSLQYFVTASISTPSTSAASSSSPTLNRSGSAFILSPRTVLLASSVSSSSCSTSLRRARGVPLSNSLFKDKSTQQADPDLAGQ